MAQDDAIVRLARQIDAAKRADPLLRSADEIAILRRRGACELHRICAEFVSSVNSRLSQATLDLSPTVYAAEMFRESGANLMQISSQGREMQITFEVPPQLVSTEKFPAPYVLEGEVSTYNQRMLERFDIRSQWLFFCLEEDTAVWRFSDWRTGRTGPVSRELLVSLMERLF